MVRLNNKIPNLKAIYLIELIMSILIISISFTSIIMTTYVVNKVPNKKEFKQAVQIATNYLHEILGKDFPTNIPCDNYNNTDFCNNKNIDQVLKQSCRVGSAIRTHYTNICQYHNLTNYGAKDVLGNPIHGLEDYNIFVNIITSNQAVLGNLSGGDNIEQANILRIDVIVTKENMPKVLLSAYKSKYL